MPHNWFKYQNKNKKLKMYFFVKLNGIFYINHECFNCKNLFLHLHSGFHCNYNYRILTGKAFLSICAKD